MKEELEREEAAGGGRVGELLLLPRHMLGGSCSEDVISL
jgi:hypothetical protein